ncbi:succinylglutamate desuccinylase/aspartoacylase family protein [Phytoactinopolyspora limicola]|uniref:succinylglutamate desuccinylase/aspartoacylase family protein n=1 Tax=Phytoactinopolyspora limicola TaxID=2715536 RepID=UPI00140E4BA1|nr:succinylglutamate desuccinylase/aspartoacylase family protein [Phytoactinopolyspora limicola]
MVEASGNRVAHAPLAGDATLTTVTGAGPGPTLALLGGVHGDEDEGVLAVRRLIHDVSLLPLLGTLRAVAPANVAAWAAHDRFSPLDGANLARVFPGSAVDGPTAAAAAAITDAVIRDSDALIDLHSAGLRYRMPLMSGYCEDNTVAKRSQQLAETFGAPVIWAHPHGAPGRSLSVAAEFGIPAFYAECSGGGSIRAWELDAYVDGVLAVMAELGMIAPRHPDSSVDPVRVSGLGDLDQGAQADESGLFVSSVRSGQVVVAGDEIGRCHAYDGEFRRLVEAPNDGMVMFLRRQARVLAGDVLFVLAQVDDAPAGQR